MIVVCNFTPVPRHGYWIGLPAGGEWQLILNSDDQDYGGSGVGNFTTMMAQARSVHGRPHALPLLLPPLSAMFLAPYRSAQSSHPEPAIAIAEPTVPTTAQAAASPIPPTPAAPEAPVLAEAAITPPMSPEPEEASSLVANTLMLPESAIADAAPGPIKESPALPEAVASPLTDAIAPVPGAVTPPEPLMVEVEASASAVEASGPAQMAPEAADVPPIVPAAAEPAPSAIAELSSAEPAPVDTAALSRFPGSAPPAPPEAEDVPEAAQPGEYSGVGGRVHQGLPAEVAIQSVIFTRVGTERIIRYAFEYARAHGRRKVTSATKSNSLQYSMVFWDDVFREVAAEYPDIQHEQQLIDSLSARFVARPESLDVIVASNLFGDILTDLGAAISGSMGLAPSANLNPEQHYPSLFQAIHGSAPDIVGRGIANPIASIWSAQLMLDFFGERQAADRLMHAIETVLAEGRTLTPDLKGTATTVTLGDAVRAALE